MIKKFLRKSETEFPNKDSYKQLKKEILRIFGPRPETATDLVGPPSSLARELKDDICQHELDCDCCPAVISYLWKKQLSAQVRAGIAHLKMSHNMDIEDYERNIMQPEDWPYEVIPEPSLKHEMRGRQFATGKKDF